MKALMLHAINICSRVVLLSPHSLKNYRNMCIPLRWVQTKQKALIKVWDPGI